MSLLDLNLNITPINLSIPDTSQIMPWLDIAYLRDTNCTVNIEIVDKSMAQSLNKQYRGKDYATNVLSFPFEEPPIEMPIKHLGDLVLCADVVISEAIEKNITADDHWAHLLIHGMLHLQGYDHLNDIEAQEMESLEVQLLEKLNINNPYLI